MASSGSPQRMVGPMVDERKHMFAMYVARKRRLRVSEAPMWLFPCGFLGSSPCHGTAPRDRCRKHTGNNPVPRPAHAVRFLSSMLLLGGRGRSGRGSERDAETAGAFLSRLEHDITASTKLIRAIANALSAEYCEEATDWLEDGGRANVERILAQWRVTGSSGSRTCWSSGRVDTRRIGWRSWASRTPGFARSTPSPSRRSFRRFPGSPHPGINVDHALASVRPAMTRPSALRAVRAQVAVHVEVLVSALQRLPDVVRSGLESFDCLPLEHPYERAQVTPVRVLQGIEYLGLSSAVITGVGSPRLAKT